MLQIATAARKSQKCMQKSRKRIRSGSFHLQLKSIYMGIVVEDFVMLVWSVPLSMGSPIYISPDSAGF
jgi:hypothetical protein